MNNDEHRYAPTDAYLIYLIFEMSPVKLSIFICIKLATFCSVLYFNNKFLEKNKKMCVIIINMYVCLNK